MTPSEHPVSVEQSSASAAAAAAAAMPLVLDEIINTVSRRRA